MINQHLKQIKKRADVNTIVKADLTSCTQCAEKLITILRETAKCAVSQVSIASGNVLKLYWFCVFYQLANEANVSDDKKINSEKIMQVLNSSVEKMFEKEEYSNGVIVCLKMSVSTLAGEIANAAQAIQEADLTLPTTDISKVRL